MIANRWLSVVSMALNALFAALLYRCQRRMRRFAVAQDRSALELQRLQRAFQGFAPQRVVEDIIERGVSISGESREVTVLFADIAGFGTLCESIAPETLVTILNGYFERVSRAVADRGYVSKFIGDGVMALFGAPEGNPWQSLDAVIAALAIRREIEAYSQALQADGHPRLDVRIGVHRGTVVAGIFGSGENMEYTVIGDVVNTAWRIQELTREHDVAILVSSEVRSALDARFQIREFPATRVKSKAAPLVTYAVAGFDEDIPVARPPLNSTQPRTD